MALALLGIALVSAAADDPAALARAVVARQLGLDVAATRIRSVTPRTFADASLDCPEAGMAYAQVVTPGHAVMVEADGRRFDVRVGGGDTRLCFARQPPAAPRPAGKPGAPAPLAPGTAPGVERARRDLAFLLRVDVSEVQVLEAHRRAPREALAGCGAAPARADETVVSLMVLGRIYQYVATGNEARPCPPGATR